jgi:hypothetical protein
MSGVRSPVRVAPSAVLGECCTLGYPKGRGNEVPGPATAVVVIPVPTRHTRTNLSPNALVDCSEAMAGCFVAGLKISRQEGLIVDLPRLRLMRDRIRPHSLAAPGRLLARRARL